MPGYVIHIAIAQEYLRKNKMNYSEEFIKGAIAPDLTDKKSETHYGKSPAYTNLNNFLMKNKLDSDYMKGFFLHLIVDYLFYNKYLYKLEKPQIYYDYDYTNKELIEKYNVKLLDCIKPYVCYKEGEPKILTIDLACCIIDEISELNIEQVQDEVKNNNSRWNYYKNLV